MITLMKKLEKINNKTSINFEKYNILTEVCKNNYK